MASAEAQHPSITLFSALNALHIVCGNAREFQRLAERRAQDRERHQKMLDLRSKATAEKARAQMQSRASEHEAWKAHLDFVAQAVHEVPLSTVPAEYTNFLREHALGNADVLCKEAREALRAGGASGLDAATHPNAAGQPRSIELHIKLREIEAVVTVLRIGLADQSVVIDKEAAKMAELGAWFGQTRDELAAVFETRGLDAPQTPSDAATDSASIDRVAERAAVKAVEAMNMGADKLSELPDLKPRDMEVWQASLVPGMTQSKIAEILNERYPSENWTQPRVSEAIKRAKANADASGLSSKIVVPKPKAPARTSDPGKVDQGMREDGTAHYLREKKRQTAKDEGEDNVV